MINIVALHLVVYHIHNMGFFKTFQLFVIISKELPRCKQQSGFRKGEGQAGQAGRERQVNESSENKLAQLYVNGYAKSSNKLTNL